MTKSEAAEIIARDHGSIDPTDESAVEDHAYDLRDYAFGDIWTAHEDDDARATAVLTTLGEL